MGPRSVLVVQHESTAPPGQLSGALAEAGLHADVRAVQAGASLPAAAAGLAGLAVLGGSMAAWEDDRAPHLPAVRALLLDAVAREVPVLAICLGAQIVADVLGGAARRGEGGVEVGWARLEPTGDDRVTGALEAGDELLLWHRDTFTPPPGSRPLLAGGPVYAEQGFRLGSVWALQPHPEVDAEIIAAWCDDPGSEAELAGGGTTRAALLDGAAERAPAGRRLLDAWATEVVSRARARPGR